MLPEPDANILWHTAKALAAAAEDVTPHDPGQPTGTPKKRPPRVVPPMVFVTDPERTPEPWRVAQNLPEEAAVIYRAFGRADALEIGLRLREATRGMLLVGQDVNLALALGADGVHLPERELSLAEVLKTSHPQLWISGAVHATTDPSGTRALDMAVIAPVFAPGPGSLPRPPLGREGFSRLARHLSCPAIALGGITGETAPKLLSTPARGLAAVRAIYDAFGGQQT